MNSLFEAAFKIKDIIVGYSLEKALEDATSNTDNLNIPTRILNYIVEQSFQSEEFELIMNHIWFQLSSPPDKWRRILKTLYLTEYLLKNGPAKFIGDLRGEIFHIRMLKRFFYQENREVKGQTIVEMSIRLEHLLSDEQLLETERKKAEEFRNKLASISKSGGSSSGRYEGFSSKEADLYLRMNSVGRNKNNETENFEEDSQQTQEPENKENYTPDGEFILRQAKAYTFDLTKEDTPEKEKKNIELHMQQIENLFDIDIAPAPQFQSDKEVQGNDKVLKEISNQVNDINEPIWDWNRAVYNKDTEKEENEDFDWTKAPQEKISAENTLPNIYNRSQSYSRSDPTILTEVDDINFEIPMTLKENVK